MDRDKIFSEARRLINSHLSQKGWRFRFNSLRTSSGRCIVEGGSGLKYIEFSKWFVNTMSDAEIIDTLRHEIAHALDYERNGRMCGHSTSWKNICREIGCSGSVTTSREASCPYKWYLVHGKERIRGYYVYPAKIARNLTRSYIPGRKQETLGMLRVVPA